MSSTLRRPEEGARPAPARAFTKGRRAWDEWIGGAMRREKFAWLIAAGCVGLAFYAERDAREQHDKGQYVPYVVERDAAGNRTIVGPLDGPRPLTEEQIRKRFLAWLRDARMIVADYAGIRQYVTDLYDMTLPGSLAQQKLIAYHQAEHPEDKAARFTTYLSKATALLAANRTWQMEWCEHTTSRDGANMNNDLWRMTATYEIDPPTTADAIEKNPEGWFVIDFDWRIVQKNAPYCASAPAGDNP